MTSVDNSACPNFGHILLLHAVLCKKVNQLAATGVLVF